MRNRNNSLDATSGTVSDIVSTNNKSAIGRIATRNDYKIDESLLTARLMSLETIDSTDSAEHVYTEIVYGKDVNTSIIESIYKQPRTHSIKSLDDG